MKVKQCTVGVCMNAFFLSHHSMAGGFWKLINSNGICESGIDRCTSLTKPSTCTHAHCMLPISINSQRDVL